MIDIKIYVLDNRRFTEVQVPKSSNTSLTDELVNCLNCNHMYQKLVQVILHSDPLQGILAHNVSRVQLFQHLCSQICLILMSKSFN